MKPIDLTLTISQETPMFPGSPVPLFIPWEDLEKDKYNLEMLLISSHTGTHVDAPFHFIKNGKKIHQIEPRRFLCNVTMIRVRIEPGGLIMKEHITSHEKKFGSIERGSSVVFATGWNDNLRRKDLFKKNPGLSESAARYLVSLGVNLVGIDSPSIDVGSDEKFSAHKALLRNDVLILENLCNLRSVKSLHFRLVALPLKLQNATGSPVRAIAF